MYTLIDFFFICLHAVTSFLLLICIIWLYVFAHCFVMHSVPIKEATHDANRGGACEASIYLPIAVVLHCLGAAPDAAVVFTAAAFSHRNCCCYYCCSCCYNWLAAAATADAAGLDRLLYQILICHIYILDYNLLYILQQYVIIGSRRRKASKAIKILYDIIYTYLYIHI